MTVVNTEIECVNKLGVLLQKPKRIKILVGGRASTKSTFVSDVVLSKMSKQEEWCCGREYQNSIDDSVHLLLTDEIDRCELNGYSILKTEINHASGGRAFYRGLARNVTSLKGLHCHGLWIEEGESLSFETLRVLTASIRVSAKDVTKAKKEGTEIRVPEIWITMNRRSSADPIAQRFLKRAESELKRCGYYEDDMVMIVQVNYTDNPWFMDSGLDTERRDDYKTMERSEYRAKWLGDYYDSVDRATIKVEWFDAAIDAHTKLGITPTGSTVTAFDVADEGGDSKGYASRKGILFNDIDEIDAKDGNEACHIAVERAIQANSDLFVYDGDGMGALLREQIDTDLKGIKCDHRVYRGSNSPDDPDLYYEGMYGTGTKDKPKKNKEIFANKRAQYGIKLANMFYNTYLAVEKGKYTDPDTIISISSDIKVIDKIRSEVCRIPRKPNNTGKIQLMSKDEMKRVHKIESPGMYDSMCMALEVPETKAKITHLTFETISR